MMATIVKKQVLHHSLQMTVVEAEVLNSYLALCLQRGNELDPNYEDYSWSAQEAILADIRELLPEAI